MVGGGLDTEPAIRLPGRKDSIQKWASRLCRMPDCHAISAGPMLRSEGGWMLNLRLDSSVERRLDAESVIRLLGRKESEYKNRHPDFAGCPITMWQAHGLCCDLRGSIH